MSESPTREAKRKDFDTLVAKQLHSQNDDIREAFKAMVSNIVSPQTSRDALASLKEPIKADSPLIQLKGLAILAALVKNCPYEFHVALGSKKWMERLIKQARVSKDERVRKKILQMLVDWSTRFEGSPNLSEYVIFVRRLRAKGTPLPSPSEGVKSENRRGPRRRPDSTGRMRAPQSISGDSQANITAVDLLLQNIYADMSNLELGLQRPEMLQHGVAEECRAHLHKISIILSTDLPESIAYDFVTMSDTLYELLGLYDALYTDSAPDEMRAERQARAIMGIEQKTNKQREGVERKEEELEELKRQYELAQAELREVKARKSKEHRSTLDGRERAIQESISKVISKAGTVRDLSGQIRELLKEHKAEITAQRASFPPELETGLMAYPEHVERMRSGEDKAFTSLKRLYTIEVATRKQLYNKLQELRGNIRVYCRVRPLNGKEKEKGGESLCVTFPAAGEILCKEGNKSKGYEFDVVFPPDTSQATVFEDTKPLINCVVDGFKVCIFAYGQTGSGKTFTMTGPKGDPGINRRAVDRLFNLVEERKEMEESSVTLSVLEIYNEQIKDLLRADGAAAMKYEIKTDPLVGQYVQNLSEFPVTSLDEIDNYVARAEKNRTSGRTNMNEHSSRSHMILYIVVKTKNLQSQVTTVGKLALVDLAGSERVGKSGATGERMKEAQAINKSLSALGDVIASLSSTSAHIPYRNSKLTHLLKDSLGGNSKCLMFVNISPAPWNSNETNQSLAFAFRARGVVLGPAKRNVTD